MLRSQDIRTSGDPVGLAGSLIRIDPDTGNASAGNPLAALRVVARTPSGSSATASATRSG